MAALETGAYSPDTIPQVVNGIQPQYVLSKTRISSLIFYRLWGSVLKDVMLPVVQKVPPQEKRLVSVGLTRLLFRGEATVALSNSEVW